MIVHHWASIINIVSVKPLRITSVSQRHLNSEKKISIISINQLNDFNSCFVTFHYIIDILYPTPCLTPAPSSTLFISGAEQCNTALLTGTLA